MDYSKTLKDIRMNNELPKTQVVQVLQENY